MQFKSEVICSDEMGCRVNGKKHWFHVWQNHMLTFNVSFVSRGHGVIEEYFSDGFLQFFYKSDSVMYCSFITGTVEFREEFTG
jgi:hypothetical protein